MNLASKIEIPADILHRDLGGEAVIANLQSGEYYGLNEVGARAWELLVEHCQLEPVYQTLLAEYAVDEAQLHADLSQLIDGLLQHGLLRVIDP